MARRRTFYKILHKTRQLLYPVAVFLAIYTFIWTSNELQQRHYMESDSDDERPVLSEENYFLAKPPGWKSIVWYDLWHGGLRMNAKAVKIDECEYNECTINFIDNQQHHDDYFNTADAVIFQGGRLEREPPNRAHKNQTYVFSTIESPVHLLHSYGGTKWYNTVNWTMTYRLDSDIPYKYGSVKLKKDLSFIAKKDYSRIFKEKTKNVAWLVSDCLTESRREMYVKELKKYVKIDIYGRCGSFKNCTKEEGLKCFDQIGKQYKFYLSFENSLCRDYMTEKVFIWFKRDIIPVVRGARNYENLLPNHTYIDAHKFDSIKSLANFLNKLSTDENEYVKYLKEKDKYETESIPMQFQRAYCELCKRLHNLDGYRKVYTNVNKWWYLNSCQRHISDIR